MSIKHIVRAPQTDRYGIEVPCKPADLGCTPVVVAGRASGVIIEAGGTATFGATSISRDTEGLVTSPAPLTITPKSDGTYLVVVSTFLDIGAAFADRIISYSVLVNGAAAFTAVKSARVGGGHSEQIIALLNVKADQSITFQLTNALGGTVTVAAFQVDFINIGP